MNKQSEYQAKYDKEHMVIYSVKYNKDIYALVDKAVNDCKLNDSGMNRNKWTVQAIIDKLVKDGYME